MRGKFCSFAFLLGLFACSSPGVACSSPGSPRAEAAPKDAVRVPVTVQAESGAVIFQSEICDTPDERSRGLMFRKEMGDKEGMIFIFPFEQHLSFWMRNTLIPLDMLFIKADHTILGIVENATPETDSPRSVPGNAQFVLEINGGLAAKHGLKAGQKVDFYAPAATQ